MSETLRCPDCGTENLAEDDRCSNCNFPLHGIPVAAAPVAATAAAPGAAAAPPAAASATTVGAVSETPGPPAAEAPAAPVAETPITLRRPIPHRPRPGRSGADSQTVSLWLFMGGFAVLTVLWIAVKANLDRANQPVEGSSQEQQKRANELQAALAKDSTNVQAQIAYGDILYDTANWPEAIKHYRTAVRLDSTQVTAIVDQGVCYYNLSEVETAETLFRLALTKDPHQPVALFNLGILSERRDENDLAMRYYHAAMQSDPPDAMREPLMKALERVAAKSGRTPGPLPDGR